MIITPRVWHTARLRRNGRGVWRWIARIVGFVLVAAVAGTSVAIGVLLIAWSFREVIEVHPPTGDEEA